MDKRIVVMAGLWLCASAGYTAPKPELRADANSAADVHAEQQQLQDERKRFQAIDTDGDGYISEAEARAHGELLEQWQKADLNADGKIDQTEFSAFESGGDATEQDNRR